MFIYGGSTGSAMGDFHELNLDTKTWSPVDVSSHPTTMLSSPAVDEAMVTLMDSRGRLNGVGRDALNGTPGGGAGGNMSPTLHTHTFNGTPTHGLGLGGLGLGRSPGREIGGSYGHANGLSPGCRFCHVGVVYDDALFVFGGYDGAHRLNDFVKYYFVAGNELPPSTLVADLKGLVDSELLSDITFIVEGVPVHAHKVQLDTHV
jgi:hypothetical protein